MLKYVNGLPLLGSQRQVARLKASKSAVMLELHCKSGQGCEVPSQVHMTCQAATGAVLPTEICHKAHTEHGYRHLAMCTALACTWCKQ